MGWQRDGRREKRRERTVTWLMKHRELVIQQRMVKTQDCSQELQGVYLLKQDQALTSFKLPSTLHATL